MGIDPKAVSILLVEDAPIMRKIEVKTLKSLGFTQITEAVDGAFVLAPIAMDLFGAGTGIRMVLNAHKSGSIFERSRHQAYSEPYGEYFQGKLFLVPHKMSVHQMLVKAG